MKKIFMLFILTGLGFTSCHSIKNSITTTTSLEGNWELTYITGPRIAFDGLYPNQKPFIHFDLKENSVSGKNSCNNYSGMIALEGSKISFEKPFKVTKMMCVNTQGETLFMSTLQKITSYSILNDGSILCLSMGDVTMMRFKKQ